MPLPEIRHLPEPGLILIAAPPGSPIEPLAGFAARNFPPEQVITLPDHPWQDAGWNPLSRPPPTHPMREHFRQTVDSRLRQGENAVALDHWAEAQQRLELLKTARGRRMPAALIQLTPEIRDRRYNQYARFIRQQEPFDQIWFLTAAEAFTATVIRKPARRRPPKPPPKFRPGPMPPRPGRRPA